MLDILIEYAAHELQMELKRRSQRIRQHGHTIVHALTVANSQLMLHEFQILHAQPQALHQPQAAAIQQLRHQAMIARHAPQHRAHLIPRQHGRQAARHLRGNHILRRIDSNSQHFAV